jgi:hypothetical protein
MHGRPCIQKQRGVLISSFAAKVIRTMHETAAAAWILKTNILAPLCCVLKKLQ